jgi:c-di-GMP-related signal transduction protein
MLQRGRKLSKRRQKVEAQAQAVLFLDLDQITKFVYRLDGPLGEGNV